MEIQCVALTDAISIHALHEESDSYNDAAAFTAKFQSTLSMRRATNAPTIRNYENLISIHALHEESDCTIPTAYYANRYFNPRSP